ncbi:uncharacterized protein J3D65DRAFT_592362 [Phyllosticta citribraziliensis]|uniref:CFEM domain-containing protein n=1 Tax=Phyllosticta citribraziliensis TaxID=989973 RepID=A0ABR1LKZ4_9PEZI
MRLWTTLAMSAAFFASAVQPVAAQSSALTALAKEMPTCALLCLKTLLPTSECATNLNQACLCSNVPLNAQLTVCVASNCTIPEGLQTKNVSLTACGAEVRDQSSTFTAIGIVGMVVAFLAFLLRMAASLGKTGRAVSWDDWTMLLLVILAIPPAVFAPILADNGMGKDIWTLTPEQITNVLHYYFFGEIFYVVALGISKISVLFFYLRVFPAKDFRMIIYATMGVCVVYCIVFGIVTALQCSPVSYAWTQWDGLHEGKCNDIHIQGYVAAAVNILLDAIVMVLPLKHLAGLNMGIKKKLMVMAMFSVGIFIVLTSIIRLESLVHFANSQNITWDYFEAGYWSLIEVYVSIICGCMPAHRFLFAKFWPKIKDTVNSTGKSTGTSSTSRSATQLSVKPNKGDETDFVPLVDVESRGGQTTSEGHKESWTVTSNTVHTSVTADSRPDSWTMGQGTQGREHV